MGPEKPLPYNDDFEDAESYIDSLLDLVANNQLLRTLVGGVHILDFFCSDPDLYSKVLPRGWRIFFAEHDMMPLLDLFLRDEVQYDSTGMDGEWGDGPSPPPSLLQYIEIVRGHLLLRDVATSQCAKNRSMKSTQKMARHVAVGMSVKKVQEVGPFARYVNDLTSNVTESTGHEITHLVDFGSGQNYLGRALASEPYNMSIVAIESKSHNAERAKEFDVMAKLVDKKVIMRNKKLYRAGIEGGDGMASLPTPPPEPASSENEDREASALADASLDPLIEQSVDAKGHIQYIEHRIEDGNLANVISAINHPNPRLMIMSLHSCGNLVHHGLRSMLLNPEVKAVAMVGCCYNLLTERLGPATYKLPELRPTTHEHPRLHEQGERCDEHGFPMSDRLCQYNDGEGIRLNITARMMAVQAPQNWGEKDSEGFFTRHFYRALLQRVFLDRGVVGPPRPDCVGGSPAGHSSGTPIIIGSLRKCCYENFVSYVRGALAKLELDAEKGDLFREKMGGITDEEIAEYERGYLPRKKDLSVIWSLMAFSAGVVEATIVTDRWLWLKEQQSVKEAWVEAVFDYRVSPRNLVVVGIKK